MVLYLALYWTSWRMARMGGQKKTKNLSLRIDEDLLRRFDYVAKSDDRSMNGLLLALVRRCIDEYERKHGKIEWSDE